MKIPNYPLPCTAARHITIHILPSSRNGKENPNVVQLTASQIIVLRLGHIPKYPLSIDSTPIGTAKESYMSDYNHPKVLNGEIEAGEELDEGKYRESI